MFEIDNNMDGKFCNLSVSFIGKTAEIWNKQGFAKEFKLLEGNPLEPVSWQGVDIGFVIADGGNEDDVKILKEVVEIAKSTCMPVLLPILVSAEPVEVQIASLIINPDNYAGESEVYKNIYYAIKSINDIAYLPGLVNLDIQDVQSICMDKKSLIFAMGEADEENAAITAAREAIDKIAKQNGNVKGTGNAVLLNVTGRESNLSMYEIQEVSETIYDWLEDAEATIIWGASIDDSLDDKIRVSILIGK